MTCLVFALLAALPPGSHPDPDGGIPLLAPPPRPSVGMVEKPYSPVVEGGYGLRISGHGYLYRGPRFEARIAWDGTVSFKDKHGTMVFAPFAWIAIPREQREPQMLVRTATEPSVQESPWLPPFERAHPPRRTPDQNEICPPSSSCGTPIPINGGIVAETAAFDLTDEIMSSLGSDPYAVDKARFLSATFEFRTKLAAEAQQALMKETLDFFPQRLEALWADTRYGPRERRRIIYELWAQADRDPSGRRAAEMIDLFVRQRLACGAPNGYTRAELDALRALHPERAFAPEACGSDASRHEEP